VLRTDFEEVSVISLFDTGGMRAQRKLSKVYLRLRKAAFLFRDIIHKYHCPGLDQYSTV
jgi:hypothetical protein